MSYFPHSRPLKAVVASRMGGMLCSGPLGAGTFGQVTLWSGRSPIMVPLMAYFLKEDWPKKTHFRWCVSDQMAEGDLCLYLVPAMRELILRGHTVEMWQAPGSATHVNTDSAKHEHVAWLYREAFRRAAVDDYFLSIEDDNLPPDRGALAQLAQHIRPDRAQIGGVYRVRGGPEYLNVSTTLNDPWQVPLAEACPRGVFHTPLMGGGFTLYLGSAMRRIPPVQCRVTPATKDKVEHVAGWDDWVGRRFADLGYTGVSDGSLWIEHHTPEVLGYLKHHGMTR